MSSTLRKPLDTIVGVQRISRSLSLIEMLPSLAAAKPLAYSRRPMSQICSFSSRSLGMSQFLSQVDFDGVEQAGAVGVYRFFCWQKRHGCLGSFADADPLAGAGAEFIDDHEILAIGLAVLQTFQAERHAYDPPVSIEAAMPARQRHGADDFSDAHGRRAPEGSLPHRKGR